MFDLKTIAQCEVSKIISHRMRSGATYNKPISCCFFCKKIINFYLCFMDFKMKENYQPGAPLLSFGNNCCLDCLFRSIIECLLCIYL